MKQFTTAARRKIAKESGKNAKIGEDVTFQHDDRTVTAHAPNAIQMAVYMAMLQKGADVTSKIAPALNFFGDLFSDDDRTYFQERLLDPTDVFDIDDVENILTFLMEEWSGRPTESSSD